jgi:hypothetical protein
MPPNPPRTTDARALVADAEDGTYIVGASDRPMPPVETKLL